MVVVLLVLIFFFELIMLLLYLQVCFFGFYDIIIGIWFLGMIGFFYVFFMWVVFFGILDEIEDVVYIDGVGEV